MLFSGVTRYFIGHEELDFGMNCPPKLGILSCLLIVIFFQLRGQLQGQQP